MMSFQDVIFFGNFLKLGFRRCLPRNFSTFFKTIFTEQLRITTSELRMKMIVTLPRKCRKEEHLKSCIDGTRPVKYVLHK